MSPREIAERLYQLADHSDELFWIHETPPYRVLYVNRAYTAMTGLTLEDLQRDPFAFRRLVHPEDLELIERNMTLAIDTSLVTECRITAANGEERVLASRSTPIRGEDGKTTVAAITVDLTARRKVQAALRDSEVRFRLVSDSAPVFIWHCDANGKCIYANRAVLEFFQQPLEAQLGDAWQKSIAPEHREHVAKDFATAVAARTPWRMEYRVRRHDGQMRWLSDVGNPIFLPNGELAGYVGSCTDVTEIRAAQEELERRLRDELQQRAQDQIRLDQQATQLAHVARVSLVGELAAGLAHELNQPLYAIANYVQGILQRLEQGASAQSILEPLRNIQADATRAADTIRRVKNFARQGETLRDWCDFRSVVLDSLRLVNFDARRLAIDVRCAVPTDLPRLFCDALQIQQVLINLLRNAYEAVVESEVPQVDVTAEVQSVAEGTRLFVTVADTGPGVRPENLEKIFNAFVSTKPEGLGMGLSISRSIIEAHGGTLWAEPNGDRGARFCFSLPFGE